MKKTVLAILLILSMISAMLTGVSAADALEEAVANPAYTVGEWSYENGTITSLTGNSSIGDGFYITDYWIDGGKRVSVSADFTISSGALEFVFSELDPMAPVQLGCLITNIDVTNEAIKMFTCNSSIVANKTVMYPLEAEVTYQMRIEFYEDGTIEQYLDDELISVSYEAGFAGAYVGVGGWNGVGTISNLVVDTEAEGSYTKPEPEFVEGTVMCPEGTTELDGLINVPAIGSWDFTDGKVISKAENLVIGDNVASSYYYVSGDNRIVYSGDFTVDDMSNCMGLCISEKSPEDALFGGLVIFNINPEVQTTNLYAPFSDTQVNSQGIPLTLEYGTTYNLRLEINKDGTMKAYIDDVLCHEIASDTRFNGGYLGVFGFNCSGTAENLTVAYGVEEEESSDTSETVDTSVTSDTEPPVSSDTESASVTTDGSDKDGNSNSAWIIIIVVAAVAVIAVVVVLTVKKKKA